MADIDQEEVDPDLAGAFDDAFNEEEDAAVQAPRASPQAAPVQAATAPDYMNEDDYDNSGGSAPRAVSSYVQGVLSAGHLGAELTAAAAAAAAPSTSDDAGRPAAVDGAAMDPTVQYKKEVFESLTEEQKNRYEAFMRSSLPRPKVRKLMQAVLRGIVPSERTVIAMCGIGKLFVGELVELARVFASAEGHQGPLLPRHVHRAFQQLKAQGKTATKVKASAKRVMR